MKLLTLILLTSALLTSNLANAANLSITDAYVRATPPHSKNSAAFMQIHNNTNITQALVSASSNVATRVELHNHIMSDGMMKMRQVDSISINANDTTELRPGSFHVMFIDLKAPLIESETIKLTLQFDSGDEIMLDIPIQKINMKHNY